MSALLLMLSLSMAQDAPIELPEPPVATATAVTGSLVLQVGKPVEATDALVDQVDALGGWFQARTADHVALRVPLDKHQELLDFAAELGKVAERSAQRVDITQPLTEAKGKLESREALLERYYEVLETADPKSIVGVERQIVQAIEQIEHLKGRIRLLEDQAAYARVDVSFRFRDRKAPSRDGSSSFRWLNTLNVTDVVYGLQRDRADWKSSGARPSAPAGFSAWKKASRFRAASPDGVLFRVRSMKHKPKADLAFWKEAVRERMVAAGYRVVSEEDVPAGARIEVVSPLGQEDWTYVIAFFPAGNKLLIAEAAGEVSAFEARRAEILDALNKTL